MSRLFAKLYLDENVDVLVADIARSQGVDVLTAVETGQIGQSDSEQLAYAVGQHRAIVTHDRQDYETPALAYREQKRLHHGILIAFPRPVAQVGWRVVALLNRLTADEIDDQVLYL